ncbi:MAG: threonine/serine exporter family protein [Clostridia bacterium]|nr:threonine/serine exporter family protein [Clostridia bacterium]
MMKEWILPVLWACTSSLGFGLIYGMRTKKLLFTGLGGALTWLAYLVAERHGIHLAAACAGAAALGTLYSEIMARVLKTPVTVFVIPVNIPMIPGGALFYSLLGLMQKDVSTFVERGLYAVIVCGSMALGIFAATILFRVVRDAPKSFKRRSKA